MSRARLILTGAFGVAGVLLGVWGVRQLSPSAPPAVTTEPLAEARAAMEDAAAARALVAMTPVPAGDEGAIRQLASMYNVEGVGSAITPAQGEALRDALAAHLAARTSADPHAAVAFAERDGGEWLAPDDPRWAGYEPRARAVDPDAFDGRDARAFLLASRRRALEMERGRITELSADPAHAWIKAERVVYGGVGAPPLLARGTMVRPEIFPWAILPMNSVPTRSTASLVENAAAADGSLLMADAAIPFRAENGAVGIIELRLVWSERERRWVTARMGIRAKPTLVVADW